jgi:very-short-patch-repair endonuclease
MMAEDELCRFCSEGSNKTCKVRVAGVAGRQAGRVAAHQMVHLGVSRTTIHDWVRAGYLHETLPRVYAVGHAAHSREADLWAAVLYAGPGAVLSHLTAAWWRGLVAFPGGAIHVSTGRACLSRRGLIVHGRRVHHGRPIVRGLPVTPLAETMLGLAACSPDLILVRKALARIEYAHGELDVAALRSACRRGRPGSARLNRALDAHDPRLACTNGPGEDDFYVFCERRRRRGIPLPQPNAVIAGIMVDAYFPGHGLVVELDGDDNHRTPAQRRRDRRNEAILRSHGLVVVRYDKPLIRREPDLVEADLRRALRSASARGMGDRALAAPAQHPAGRDADAGGQDQGDEDRHLELEEHEVDLELVRVQHDEEDRVDGEHADPDVAGQVLARQGDQ